MIANISKPHFFCLHNLWKLQPWQRLRDHLRKLWRFTLPCKYLKYMDVFNAGLLRVVQNIEKSSKHQREITRCCCHARLKAQLCPLSLDLWRAATVHLQSVSPVAWHRPKLGVCLAFTLPNVKCWCFWTFYQFLVKLPFFLTHYLMCSVSCQGN